MINSTRKGILDFQKKYPYLFSSIFTILILLLVSVISFIYFKLVPNPSANISLFYIFSIILISRFTSGYWFGITASICAVISINYLYTFPYFALNFTLSGYPVTFLIMLAITLMTCTMTTHSKQQAAMLAEREKQLAEAETEKMRANLLRAVSHDLRTPLTGIIGNASTYLENEHYLEAADKRTLIENIGNDANWLLNMVENLLTITRIREEDMHINTSFEYVEEVVSEAIVRLKKRYPDIEINAQVPDELIMIPMDAMLIEQVIINLLENAILHSGNSSDIDLSVNNTPNEVLFSVKDHGHGISEDLLTYIFEGKCYSGSQTSDAHKGMGIGLSICKTIITAHHGTIEARNHENGAEFYFSLPKEVSS